MVFFLFFLFRHYSDLGLSSNFSSIYSVLSFTIKKTFQLQFISANAKEIGSVHWILVLWMVLVFFSSFFFNYFIFISLSFLCFCWSQTKLSSIQLKRTTIWMKCTVWCVFRAYMWYVRVCMLFLNRKWRETKKYD